MDEKIKEFLDSNIICKNCQNAAECFSITFNEELNKYNSKYGEYCSLYCIIHFSQANKS